jgi:hypothetical protein
LAAAPDVARDLQRKIAAQRLDGAGIGISSHSVFTITLANILWKAGIGSRYVNLHQSDTQQLLHSLELYAVAVDCCRGR